MDDQNLTPEQAANAVLLEEVVLPAFAEKCAAHGVTFQTPEQLAKAWETAQYIKAASAAGTGESIIDKVHADVCNALQVPSAVEKQAEDAVAERQAADERIRAALAVLAQAGQQQA